MWPGAWDLAVTETVNAEESFDAAMARGLAEELGIELRFQGGHQKAAAAAATAAAEGGGEGAVEGGFFATASSTRDGASIPGVRWEKVSGGPTRNCWRGRMPHMQLWDCHLTQLYVVTVPGADLARLLNRTSLQGEEVDDLEVVGVAEANRRMARMPGNFTPWTLAAVYNGGVRLFAPLQEVARKCDAGCAAVSLGREDRCVARCVRRAAVDW